MIIYFIFIFGLLIGSFLNCLIWRLHNNEGMWNRSYCPKCKKQISWYDNIPIFSYIFLLGRCRHCHKRISWQYPVVELATGVLFVLAYQMRITSYELLMNNEALIWLLRDFFIISAMIIVFIYDLRWYLILDKVTFPTAIIIFALNLFLGVSIIGMLVSLLIGGGFFLVQFLISKGKWIGGGDIRLGALMGIIFGQIDTLLTAIMIAYFMGSIVGVGLILFGKKKWGSKLPLGVFLALATIITLFFGESILNWYFQLIR